MLIPSLGERGEGKTTFKPLHYKGTPIHRIVKGFIIQGGDFSVGKTNKQNMFLIIVLCYRCYIPLYVFLCPSPPPGDGTGGESIYGGMFKGRCGPGVQLLCLAPEYSEGW